MAGSAPYAFVSPIIADRTTVLKSRAAIPFAFLACLLVAAACTSSGDDVATPATVAETTLLSGEATEPTTEAAPDDTLPDEDEANQPDEDADVPDESGDEDDFTAGVETIDWESCDLSDNECGFVEVPADYADPSAGTLQIAVNVFRARDQENRIGYLFINPGGPGGSGVEIVDFASLVFDDPLLDQFDIIGFDPRGVGASEPSFECGEPGEVIGLFNSTDPPIDTPAEVEIVESAVDLCVQSMGVAAGRLHSEFVARDMDEIRKALGAEEINYLGFSYGSALGFWYATLFPDSVRAMVVDGADNPLDDLSTQEIRVQNFVDETSDFERLLNDALASCDSDDCPIFNDGDPVGYYFDAADKFGLVVADVSDNPDAAILGLIQPLYNEDAWPTLHQAIFELNENDDATVFAGLARSQLLAAEDGMNITGWINCLDSYSLFPELDRATQLGDGEAIEAAFKEEFPLLYAANIPSVGPCPFVDTIAPPPFEGEFNGSDVPILVIGNVSDPATPFSESEEVVEETLSNGFLVEVDHPSHVVYPANDCVNGFVHDMLISGNPPDDRRSVCDRQERTADDQRADIKDVCFVILPNAGLDLPDDEADAACDELVMLVEEGMGLDEFDNANAGDEAAGARFQEILLEWLTELI